MTIRHWSWSLCIVSILILACQSEKPTRDLVTEIATLEHQLAEAPDDNKLQGLAGLYQEASDAATTEEDRLKYLWKTGETARALKRFDEAARILSSIYDKHPQSEYASKALFLHAFMLDEDKGNIEDAKTLYLSFIERYPDSDFQDDAVFLLENLGRSDEEILRTLTEKNN